MVLPTFIFVVFFEFLQIPPPDISTPSVFHIFKLPQIDFTLKHSSRLPPRIHHAMPATPRSVTLAAPIDCVVIQYTMINTRWIVNLQDTILTVNWYPFCGKNTINIQLNCGCSVFPIVAPPRTNNILHFGSHKFRH